MYTSQAPPLRGGSFLLVGAAQLTTLASLLKAGCLRSATAVTLPVPLASGLAALHTVPNGSVRPPSLRSAATF
ncbi:hypothetical protein PR003_g5618 [Phytophthora rubi]|uniref:Uncharacterized protein n=1 Tax=Phytophthora rubi TaxID=129364 RepID=A0A6A3N5Z2_9STRA|nr:hypothetical protein PR002_g5714 [Phytophthora rubi]KAE9044677.1 hypothetical protein PR001_g5279 [Phytophthora rubi]KAE9349934.1 hypothetical protein PR003_g5618 [Phytophthora rubi]